MERLTFEGNFCDIAQCTSVPGGSFCENGACSQRQIWERLKAIEDVLGDEYELERLGEMTEAEKDGRLEVLPCKVGDTVFVLEADEENSQPFRIVVFVAEREFDYWMIPFFGKVVFLTREAAEAALAKGATK